MQTVALNPVLKRNDLSRAWGQKNSGSRMLPQGDEGLNISKEKTGKRKRRVEGRGEERRGDRRRNIF
jgi:hypothetical protein